jgi:hypothetical protein
MDLNIITVDGQLAPCEFHLLTKDGVYLMQIPRLVTDLVLAVANRCAGLKPGTLGSEYTVPAMPEVTMVHAHGVAVQMLVVLLTTNTLPGRLRRWEQHRMHGEMGM